MGDATDPATVHRCFVDTTGNTRVIYLTATATQPVKVAWIVLG